MVYWAPFYFLERVMQLLFYQSEDEIIPIPWPLVNYGVKMENFKPIYQIDDFYYPEQDPKFQFSKQLQLFLIGRALLIEEVPFSLEEIHEHVKHGYIRYIPGQKMSQDKKEIICQRCCNTDLSYFAEMYCSRCHSKCLYCRRCIMMGRVSTCTPLLIWVADPPLFTFPNCLKFEGKLSPLQKKASNKVIKTIVEGGNLLLWAVCGAGKTEMLFEGIETGLSMGKRIAIATPRTDVVLELSNRFKKAFPDVPIVSLYGGSHERHSFAPLVITTTHQLIRFRSAFDVLIIDEVDAFPYSVDDMLQKASRKAMKEESAVIYLSATPSEVWQQEVKTGKRNCFILPARFHRKALPVPTFRWCGNWRKSLHKGKIPSKLKEWVFERVKKNQQAFIFFPHIELMEEALPLFQTLHPKIESVHAEDPSRKQKVQEMRDGKLLILLTTMILERGVTISNLDVAVLGAEDETFTESALVQISGRVGRNPNYPNGDITFFHFGITRSMVLARRQIIEMNKKAREQGLIDN